MFGSWALDKHGATSIVRRGCEIHFGTWPWGFVDFKPRHPVVSNAMASRVWILGAGFSRALGGPLLADLLSLRTYRRLWVQHEKLFKSREAQWVYQLYHFGRKFPEGEVPGLRHDHGPGVSWFSDAEDFLEQLSAAQVESSQDRTHLKQLIHDLQSSALPTHLLRNGIPSTKPTEGPPDLGVLLKTATRMIAAECSWYVPSPASIHGIERAIPFRRWADMLGPHDAVITFNYDCLLESLRPDWFVPPLSYQPTNSPKLFKLHGSVDWQEDLSDPARPVRRVKVDPDDENYFPILGMPGNAKAEIRKQRLSQVWEQARSELGNASQVHIVGYGLPESDASAREFLLDGLVLQRLRHGGRISIVLGNNEFAARRLQSAILEAVGDGDRGSSTLSGVLVRPQFAQDYLQAFASLMAVQSRS